jgi:hypothetical protein
MCVGVRGYVSRCVVYVYVCDMWLWCRCISVSCRCLFFIWHSNSVSFPLLVSWFFNLSLSLSLSLSLVCSLGSFLFFFRTVVFHEHCRSCHIISRPTSSFFFRSHMFCCRPTRAHASSVLVRLYCRWIPRRFAKARRLRPTSWLWLALGIASCFTTQ